MDLPDCPPGAEGYEDTVVEMPKKPDETICTKAEKEFQDHIASLKIHVDDGSTRCMVERRGRDVAGKWIYLCYPCAAFCSGESILQGHISGKKHKNKLAQKNPWPVSIFEQHPFILGEKGETTIQPASKNERKNDATGSVLKKMAEEVELYNAKPSELNLKYNKYREATCHIQEILDKVKTPLLGLEYVVEHPPEEAHHEPSYMCTLCNKQGHPRTIVSHLTCFWHRQHFIIRHFPKASALLAPYRSNRCREAVALVMSRLAQRIEDKYGRLRPVNIDKEVYEKEKDLIHQWLFKSYHFSEKPGATFEEVVDTDLIKTLGFDTEQSNVKGVIKKDPSPPVVAAPTKPRVGERARRLSPDSLSDISLDEPATERRDSSAARAPYTSRAPSHRFEPYPDARNATTIPGKHRDWRAFKNSDKTERELEKDRQKRDYKLKLAQEMREKMELSSKKMLAYHEKNPEKHPLYPEEWKKFWNRRYKEIQADGKDPSKHDFKPEWIVFWTQRMKELHDEEVKVHVLELYRKMCLTPPDMTRRDDKERRKSPRRPSPRRASPEPRWSPRRRDPARRPPEPRRRSPERVDRRRSPEPRRPEPLRRSPEPRKRTPELRRRSPIPRRRSPEHRRRSSEHRPHSSEYRRELRSPVPPRPAERHYEPQRAPRPRSRSPVRPVPRRSPARTHFTLESARRSRSPLSARAAAPLRNRSPAPAAPPAMPPSLQTVQVSDDELKLDDGLSPWNSDRSLESLPEARSPARSRSRASEASRASRRPQLAGRAPDPQDLGPPENIVATLRLLVALEDYLGSIGPKIVDLLTEALKMEKEKANSSEDLLVRDSAVVLIETAKEKLKGAVQAGLVAGGAASAVRAAVVRAAATLHAADTRTSKLKKEEASKPTALPVAGVGEVDRAHIAQQMAAALIAQGKTDVSSEELAQLVDAVVGMAEAKKREAAVKTRAVERPVERPRPTPPAPAPSGTASALQMLQSAYDENDKRLENDAATDAMDGLSDSDLETLLKNFNELSAEEQHSLIAYLKKLEARSPQRVERLRQYVSAAAAAGPAPPADDEPPPQPERPPERRPQPVTIDSDDDDYTVEEVFKSATEKVKENQIRQEMEIVKKSLEETKASPAPTPEIVEKPAPAPKEVIPTVDLTSFSSAPPTVDLTSYSSASKMVDLTNYSSASDLLALVQASIQSTSVTAASSQASDVVVSSSQPRSFGDRSENSSNQPARESRPLLSNPTQDQPPQQSFGNQQGGSLRPPPTFQNRGKDSWNQTTSNQTQMQDSLRQDSRGSMMDERSPMQDNMGSMNDNRGPVKDNRGPMQDNRGSMQDNRGSMQDNRTPMQDNRGPIQDNRGPMQDNWNPMQDNRGPMQDNRDSMQDNWGMQDNRGPPMQNNRAPLLDNWGMPVQDNRMMQDNRPPYMQGPRPYMQDNRGPNMQNRPPLIPGGPMRPQGFNNFTPTDHFNQGPRGNFMNGNNYDMNFRGRGRGQFGGPMRGRGRGYY